MNAEDFKLIDFLVSLKEAGMKEKDEASLMIKKYLDAGFSMCKTCDPQVSAAFKRLRTWWALERENYNNLLNKKTKKK